MTVESTTVSTPAEPAESAAASTPVEPAESASPYLGLRSFAEADRELFHGREAETSELLNLVERETLSVVFGRSGLGKSSLLRAGLFPRLRDASLFPIAVRLTYSGADVDLVAQIRAAIAAAIAEHQVDATPPPADQTLWEYFHRTPFWSARNRPLLPVIAIDQFEELFTVGKDARARIALLRELGDVVENRIPAAVRAVSDADALPAAYQVPKAKLILALREDYLARLEDLRAQIPSIAHGRFRLRAMDGNQALRAVRHDRTAGLVEPSVAERIVRFVAGAQGNTASAGEAELGDLTIEPALLSLVCRQLDDVRRTRHEPAISADLLTGESSRILDDFYERSVADLPSSIVAYLEDHLLTPDGHRTTVAMSRLAAIAGMEPAVTALVDRRLLRIEVRLDQPHVEVIHDVLTRVIVARRDRRRIEQQRRRRARRWFAAIGGGALFALLATATGLYLGARHRLEVEAERQRAVVEFERRANAQRSATTLTAEASAMLARDDPWAAARVLEVAYGITGQDSPPELALLVGRITALDSMLAAVLQPKSSVTALAFSPDGRRLFAGHQDGTVSMWSTSDWKVTHLAKHQATTDAERVTLSAALGHAAMARANAMTAPGTGNPGPPAVRIGPILALGVSDDGRYAAAIDAGGDTTVWDTATRQVRGTIAMERASLQISHDGAWIVATNGYSDNLYHFADGNYVPWIAPAMSASCLPRATGQPALASIGRRRRTLGISGDGSILAVHHYEAVDKESAGELSVFALGSGTPSLLTTRCVPTDARVTQLAVNVNGTAIALQRGCSDQPDGCEATFAIYRPGLRPLASIPPATRIAFDARRPEPMLVTGADRFDIAETGDTEAYRVLHPCKGKLETDLVDGRLAALGACGAYVIAGRGLPAITGEIPLASYSAIRVSAAAQLAATLSPDGVIRVWHLRGSPDRTLDTGPDLTRVTTTIEYLGRDRVMAYDGVTARIFATASAEPVATAPSDTAPVVVDDDTVAVSRRGELGFLSGGSKLRIELGAAAGAGPARSAAQWSAPTAALVAVRNDADVLVVTSGLQVRRANQARSTEYQALDSPLPHTALRTVAHAPSGRWMLGAGDEALVRLDATGRAEPPVAFAGDVQAIVPAVHGDGLLVVGDHAVAAWSEQEPPVLLESPSHARIVGRAGVWDMATGAIVLGTETGLVRLDVRTGKPVWQVPAPFGSRVAITWIDLDAHGTASSVLATSGSRMALFSIDDGHMLGEFYDCMPSPGDAIVHSWFLSSSLLVTRSQAGEVSLWDARTGDCLSSSTKRILDMAEGASDDFAVVLVRGSGLLHVQNRKLVLEAPFDCDAAAAQPHHVAWSPDGQWIALAGPRLSGADRRDDGDRICLWNHTTRRTATLWGSQQAGITELAFSADGRLFSTDGSRPRSWSVPTGSLISEFAREILFTAMVVDGRPYVITQLSTGPLRIYDARSGKPVAEARSLTALDTIARYAVDEASGLLAVAYYRGGGAVFDVRTGERIRDLSTDEQAPFEIAIAAGGHAVAIATTDRIRIWRLSSLSAQTAASDSSPATLDTSGIRAMAFSPDGAWLAAAGGELDDPDDDLAGDGVAGGRDAPGPSGQHQIRFSKRELRALPKPFGLGGYRGMFGIWSSDGGQVLSLKTWEVVKTVVWSRDGTHLAVGGDHGLLKTFDVTRETRDPATITRMLDSIAPKPIPQAASPLIQDRVLERPRQVAPYQKVPVTGRLFAPR